MLKQKNEGTLVLDCDPDCPPFQIEDSNNPKTGKNVGIIEKIIDNCVNSYSDKVAIRYGKLTVTYSDVLILAKKIAASIQNNIVGNSPVGLICSKNTNFVSAWLGGILSGKLFYQIDGSWPVQRIEKLLKLAGSSILIDTTDNEQGHWQQLNDVKVLNWKEIVDNGNSNYLGINLSDHDRPAYMLFTSGTTGEPKGVLNNIWSIDHFFRWYVQHYGFDTHDKFSLLSGITHDPVIRDIITPLLIGSEVVIPTSIDLSSPSNLSRFLLSNHISVVHLTPPMGKILFELSSVDFSCGAVKHLAFGGDRLRLDLVEKCLNRAPGVQVSNFYGATETPQVMLYNKIDLVKLNHYREAGLTTAPVGVPIPGVEVHLEKERGIECAKGEEGQIVLKSQYLSIGYLTMSKQEEDHDDNPGRPDKIYKTGDYGKKLENGEIDCLGRRDRQVKIRGYRIEPVEIENILRRMDCIDDIVVQKDSSSDELDAFIVYKEDSLDVLSLNTHLREYLPAYVQIKNIFRIDKINLTSNNKIDYDYLETCKLKQKKRIVVSGHQGHNNAVQVVLEVFQDILNLQGVDPAAQLLELGCDSLKSFEIVENINNRLGAQIGTIELYECQTAAAVAEFIEKGSITRTGDHWKADDLVNKLNQNKKNVPCRYMKKDTFCQFLISRIYAHRSPKLRWFLDEIILRREGGAWFTVTLRQLYKKYYNISIGDYTSFCFRVGNFKRTTTFGRYCDVTRTARFETANHPSNTISVHGIFYQQSLGFSKGMEIPRNRIKIGNDVHIGHNSAFLYPGKEIGDGAIIGAGAIVNFDVPPYAIVAGNPGRIIRYRFDKATIKELLRSKWWDYSLEELEIVRDEFIKPLMGKYVV